MRQMAALALAIAAVAWVHALGETATVPSAGAALALGFTLLGAWISGDLLRRFNLPRLTGYLIFGVLVGPYVGNVITAPMTSQLQAVTGIATTLIALIAGLTISLERLRSTLTSIARFTGATFAVVIIGIAALVWLAWPWLAISPGSTGVARVVIVLLLTIMVASVSPTMTAAVTTETGGGGRLSELVLAVVVLADLVLLILFSFSMQLARAVFRPDAAGPSLLVRFAWETGGAIAFGVLVGALFALYLRYVGREVTLVLLAMCALLTQVGSTQQFEPLLAAVAAGLVIENLSAPQGDALRTAVQRGAPPVLVIFFVSIGSSLRLDALLTVWPVALALAAVRTGLIRVGTRVGLNVSAIDRGIGEHAWTGLISQAGITVGLASVVASEFPGWGTELQTLLIAVIAIHELIGPMLFRRGLARSGELEARSPRPLLVVSNREPYLHVRREDGSVTWTSATGGVAVALDALMRERGGTWIAHGAGSANRLVVDDTDKVAVPPEHPSYSLRRLWLEEPTFSAYYGGFANEGLWPLCHVVDVRPQFRSEQWAAYKDVNERFAAAIDEELDASDTPIFLQDYHLALVAPALRARRASVRTALFWHIPWPHPDRLRICPWRVELLDGLAANDLLAFQLERDRRNFLQAAEGECTRRLTWRLRASGSAIERPPSSRYRSGLTTIASRRSAVPTRSSRNSSACIEAWTFVRRSSASASTASTIPRVFQSVWLHSTGCSRSGLTCGATSHSSRSACRHDRTSMATAKSRRRSRRGSGSSTGATVHPTVHRSSRIKPRLWGSSLWWRSTVSRTSASSARCTTG